MVLTILSKLGHEFSVFLSTFHSVFLSTFHSKAHIHPLDPQISRNMPFVTLIGGSSTIIYSRFKYLLDSFIDASTGVVNERKSQVFGWYTSPRIIHSIPQIFHFLLAKNWTSFKYLGIHITLKSSYIDLATNYG
jgi:hypothetical protein